MVLEEASSGVTIKIIQLDLNLNDKLYGVLTFWAVGDARADDLVANIVRVEISTRLGLPNMSGEGATALVRGQILSRVGEVEVVVAGRISTKYRVIKDRCKVNGSSLECKLE